MQTDQSRQNGAWYGQQADVGSDQLRTEEETYHPAVEELVRRNLLVRYDPTEEQTRLLLF